MSQGYPSDLIDRFIHELFGFLLIHGLVDDLACYVNRQAHHIAADFGNNPFFLLLDLGKTPVANLSSFLAGFIDDLLAGLFRPLRCALNNRFSLLAGLLKPLLILQFQGGNLVAYFFIGVIPAPVNLLIRRRDRHPPHVAAESSPGRWCPLPRRAFGTARPSAGSTIHSPTSGVNLAA